MTALLLLGCFSACAGATPAEGGADTVQIVTTIFPICDWVRSVLGDNPANAEVAMLLDTGVDLHRFQPTADDILRISNCDLFLYVGGESDAWAEAALDQAANKDMIVLNLLEILGDEEIVEGMQAEDEEEGEDCEVEYDEHVWLSLRNAAVLVVLTGTVGSAMLNADTLSLME